MAFITYHYKIVWCSVSQDGFFFNDAVQTVFCQVLPGISPTANSSSWHRGWRLSPFSVRRRWNDIWAPCQMWVLSPLTRRCQMWLLLCWLPVQRGWSHGFTSFLGSQEGNPPFSFALQIWLVEHVVCSKALHVTSQDFVCDGVLQSGYCCPLKMWSAYLTAKLTDFSFRNLTHCLNSISKRGVRCPETRVSQLARLWLSQDLTVAAHLLSSVLTIEASDLFPNLLPG